MRHQTDPMGEVERRGLITPLAVVGVFCIFRSSIVVIFSFSDSTVISFPESIITPRDGTTRVIYEPGGEKLRTALMKFASKVATVAHTQASCIPRHDGRPFAVAAVTGFFFLRPKLFPRRRGRCHLLVALAW